MKKIILSITAILSIATCYTQTGNRDSIKLLLQKEKTDTGRVLLLAELSYQLHESKPDTAMILALEALSLSRRIGFEKGEAGSFNRVGGAYSIIGNYPKAMEAFLQALKINEKINNQDGIQINYNNIGNLYISQEDYRQSLGYYFKAKTLAKQLNNKRSLSIHYTNIAGAYHHLKIYDSAMQYAQQANDLAYKINFGRMIGSSLLVLGRIHFEKGQTSSALEHYLISIPYAIGSKNDLSLSETFLDIAKVFEKMGQNDSVLFYANQSLLLAKEKGFINQIRDAGRYLTAFYRGSSMPDSALFYMDITKVANDSLFS